MRDFVKNVLACLLAMVVFGLVVGFIAVGAILGMLVSGGTGSVAEGSVMVINLSGSVEERESDNIWDGWLTEEANVTGLDRILGSIESAKSNDKVKGIYLRAGIITSIDPASAKAIRRKLEEFRSTGKWIVSYGDSYSQMSYYICSVADKVMVNPEGIVDWHGISSRPMFLKELLERLGIKVQLVKVGKYKSAPEMLTADGMSEANREQVTAYIKGIWSMMKEDVSESRGISTGDLDGLADAYMAFSSPEKYIESRLADTLVYESEVKGIINGFLGRDADEEISKTGMDAVLAEASEDQGDGVIAVCYASGEIEDSRISGIGSGEESIDMMEFTECLGSLADDDNVKAVVLRVNSPGGSAYASEQIWHAVDELKQRKPVVVSMGGYAASGGYYISCGADYIISEPATLTGSIGIYGMFPDFGGLLRDKLGIGFDVVKTNRMSDLGDMSRPINAEERRLLEAYVERGYGLFRRRVAEGRGLPEDSVEQLAQGRVWLGSDALEKGLVDSLGSLDDAIRKAALLAGIKSYRTEVYPEQASWVDQLFGDFEEDAISEGLREWLGTYWEPVSTMAALRRQSGIRARLPFVLLTK